MFDDVIIVREAVCDGSQMTGAPGPPSRRMGNLSRVTKVACEFGLGDEVPHILTRKSRLQAAEFLITSAKRLLQHYPSQSGRHLLNLVYVARAGNRGVDLNQSEAERLGMSLEPLQRQHRKWRAPPRLTAGSRRQSSCWQERSIRRHV